MGCFLEPRKQTTGIHRVATAKAHVSKKKERTEEQRHAYIYMHDTHIEEKGRSKERRKTKLPAKSTGRET